MVARLVNGRHAAVQASARLCKEAMPQACLEDYTVCMHASAGMCWQAQEMPATLHLLMCTPVEAEHVLAGTGNA